MRSHANPGVAGLADLHLDEKMTGTESRALKVGDRVGGKATKSTAEPFGNFLGRRHHRLG